MLSLHIFSPALGIFFLLTFWEELQQMSSLLCFLNFYLLTLLCHYCLLFCPRVKKYDFKCHLCFFCWTALQVFFSFKCVGLWEQMSSLIWLFKLLQNNPVLWEYFFNFFLSKTLRSMQSNIICYFFPNGPVLWIIKIVYFSSTRVEEHDIIRQISLYPD